MTGPCREQASVFQGKALAATGHVMRSLKAVADWTTGSQLA